MKKHSKVYRFTSELFPEYHVEGKKLIFKHKIKSSFQDNSYSHEEKISGKSKITLEKFYEILSENYELPLAPLKNITRDTVDASYLEHHFETRFFELYGESAYNYLSKEEKLIGFYGENIFADYVIEKHDNRIIIEENGESYHHPQKTGIERYNKQIMRQNALVYQGFKVYRFSTEEIQIPDKMIAEMEFFFGEKKYFISKGLFNEERKFELYEHQNITLEKLSELRDSKVKSALIVLPTGTGKSTIALEDLKKYLKSNIDKKVLIIVPTNALKKQWQENIEKEFEIKDFETFEQDNLNIKVTDRIKNTPNETKRELKKITIMTQSAITRKKYEFSTEEFGYILVDEAHHSVAEGISKVIRYFSPDFLLGMTATPERLDRKRLEDIFSTVETRLNLKEAIEKGICSPIRVFRLESNIDLSQVRFNGKEYIAGDLEKKIVVTSRNELIADTIDKYFGMDIDVMRDKQGIIFCVNVKHAEIMANLLNERGISAKAVSGKDSKSQEHLEEYLHGKIRFLCSCQLISEGWDAPSTSILVMARPTMSKVLYYQQLGRGTRKAKGKDSLYVVDVVDNYGFNSAPWSTNAIFGNAMYRPFGDIIAGSLEGGNGELAYITHLLEREKDLIEIDIETFQDKYGDMIGSEEVARELFVSTGTVKNWVKNGDITPDYTTELGRQKIYRFKPERVEEIRILKKLKKRDKSTVLEDFWEFINEGDYSLSYKIIFILAFLKNLSKNGEADFGKVKQDYINYYRKRLEDGLPVDRSTCPFTFKYLKDDKKMEQNILINPFEKFERKRFIYYAKDIKNIGFDFNLWEKFQEKSKFNSKDNSQLEKLREKMFKDLAEYYKDLGGSGDISIFEGELCL